MVYFNSQEVTGFNYVLQNKKKDEFKFHPFLFILF